MASRRRSLLPALLGATATLAAGAFAWLWLDARALPEGPVPIVWDREACTQCRMHIGEPGFAAQLQLPDGRVLDFDDPGCLFTWLAAHPGPLRAVWFRHHGEDRWLSAAQVGFVAAPRTPMGYGLAATDAAAPGAKSFEAVRAEFQARGPRAEGRVR